MRRALAAILVAAGCATTHLGVEDRVLVENRHEAPTVLPAEVRPITVLTWNVHGLVGGDRRFDVARVASVILASGADVVALQELGDTEDDLPEDAPDALARAVHMKLLFAESRRAGRARFGNAVLTRLPVLSARKVHLTDGPIEPKNVLVVELEVAPGVVLTVAATHLTLFPGEHHVQASRLGRHVLDRLHDRPAVVCGDFNDWFSADRGPFRRWGFQDAVPHFGAAGDTFPARAPRLRLDRFYVNGHVRVHEVRVYRTELAERASDHLPLLCRVEVRPTRPRPRPRGEAAASPR